MPVSGLLVLVQSLHLLVDLTFHDCLTRPPVADLHESILAVLLGERENRPSTHL